MEVMVIVLGEFLMAMLAPLSLGSLGLLIIFGEVFAPLIHGLIRYIIAELKKGPAKSDQSPRSEAFRLRKLPRWVTLTGISLVSLVIAGFLAINLLFFDATIAVILTSMEKRTGIHLEYGNRTGNLLSSQISVNNVRIQRQDHEELEMDLAIERIDLAFGLWDLLVSPKMGALEISGVRGELILHPNDGQTKTRRHFSIANLTIEDLDLNIENRKGDEPVTIPISIASWNSPFRSQFMVLDVLFGGNGSGTLAGANFSVTNKRKGDTAKSYWNIEGMPLHYLHSQLPKPLDRAVSGVLDVNMTSEWDSDTISVMHTQWDLLFQDLALQIPEDAGKYEQALALALEKAAPLPISFVLEINPLCFAGKTGAEAAGLWPLLKDKTAEHIAEKTGINQENTKEILKQGIDLTRDWLEKKRESKEQQE